MTMTQTKEQWRVSLAEQLAHIQRLQYLLEYGAPGEFEKSADGHADCIKAIVLIATTAASDIPGRSDALEVSPAEAWFHCFMWCRSVAKAHERP